MSMNWWGVILSFVFVFGVLGVAGLLLKRQVVSATVSRKLVHIGVAHWWLIAMYFFDDWRYAIVGPVAFILINLASYLFRLLPAMEHEVRSRNLGTVYFPVSLLVLVLLSWAGTMEIWVAGIGIMVLGYGDGFASLFGEQYARSNFRVFGNDKSVIGSLVMFFASLAVVIVFIVAFGGPQWGTGEILVAGLATALVATVVETLTPFGLDNLTVPILTALFCSAVFA